MWVNDLLIMKLMAECLRKRLAFLVQPIEPQLINNFATAAFFGLINK